jgi:hypothetical protein
MKTNQKRKKKVGGGCEYSLSGKVLISQAQYPGSISNTAINK